MNHVSAISHQSSMVKSVLEELHSHLQAMMQAYLLKLKHAFGTILHVFRDLRVRRNSIGDTVQCIAIDNGL